MNDSRRNNEDHFDTFFSFFNIRTINMGEIIAVNLTEHVKQIENLMKTALESFGDPSIDEDLYIHPIMEITIIRYVEMNQ